jgi:S1-C subfamily serine protease
MITANVIHRVFRIRVDGAEGTAFTIEIDNREYLVTAKHVAESVTGEHEIELFSHGGWTNLRVEPVGHAAGDSDISVLAARVQLTAGDLPLPATSIGVIYGQDVYFLGFPYGFLGRYTFEPSGYPLPFVKRATVSMLDGPLFLLDGHNNPGFSGGPVVFRKPGEQELNVAAVVSGFHYVDEPIYSGSGPTPLTYQYNTGIIVTHSIDAALDLIAARPVGCSTEGAV